MGLRMAFGSDLGIVPTSDNAEECGEADSTDPVQERASGGAMGKPNSELIKAIVIHADLLPWRSRSRPTGLRTGVRFPIECPEAAEALHRSGMPRPSKAR